MYVCMYCMYCVSYDMNVVCVILDTVDTDILMFKCAVDYFQEKAAKKEKAAVDGVFFR